jgi:hypothetical protein
MAEFGRRLGFADKALADAQRAGLRTILFGRCKFVLGSDALDWFRRLGEQQTTGGDKKTADSPTRAAAAFRNPAIQPSTNGGERQTTANGHGGHQHE